MLLPDSNNLVYEHCIFPRDEAAKKCPAGRVAPIRGSVEW